VLVIVLVIVLVLVIVIGISVIEDEDDPVSLIERVNGGGEWESNPPATASVTRRF